jgi:hypothetical protein
MRAKYRVLTYYSYVGTVQDNHSCEVNRNLTHLFLKYFEPASEPSLQPLSSDLPRASAIAVSVEATGTLPVPESCSEKPDSHCTSQPLHLGGSLHWRTTLFCSGVLNFPLIHTPGSRIERPQTRSTADVAGVANFADVRRVLTRFSDKFVRGLRPPEPNQNRTACRSPTVARPSPHDIPANSPNFSPHPRVLLPNCGDCPCSRDRWVTTVANLQVIAVLTKDPASVHRSPPNAAGIVPATGVLSNDYCESSG